MHKEDLDLNWQGVDYSFVDVDYDTPCPGDYWTPGDPGGVTGYGKVLFFDEKNKDYIDVTTIFESLTDDDEVFEALWEVLNEQWEGRAEDAAEAAWEAKRDEGLL